MGFFTGEKGTARGVARGRTRDALRGIATSIPLFANAQETSQTANQRALNTLRRGLSAQTQPFIQGNVEAQQALLRGLPAFESAILGTGSRDLGGPVALDVNTGFLPQRVPGQRIDSNRFINLALGDEGRSKQMADFSQALRGLI